LPCGGQPSIVMASRKGRLEHTDFATKLINLGFIQRGECTFYGERVKIFRATKLHSDLVRYWEVQEISTGNTFYKSNHTADILNFLQDSLLIPSGATIFLQLR